MSISYPVILSIAPYKFLPAKTGGHLGIAMLHHYLGQRSEDHIICTTDNGSGAGYSFQLHPILSAKPQRYIPYRQLQEMVNICKQYKAEYIYLDHPYMAFTAIALSKQLGIPWYMRSHNIESDRFRTLGKKWWPVMAWYEGYAMRNSNGVFFVTEEDKQLAKSLYQLPESKGHIIPYGTELSKPPVPKHGAKEQIAAAYGLDIHKPWLYFLGVLNYYPNEQAVNFIINEIVPRLNNSGQPYQLLIGGKGMAEPIQQQIAVQKDTMQYVGFIDDLDTFLQACDMMLNPVQLGGGIKTKAVEALGYNKNVVSTASGAAGISAAACGKKLWVVADNDWDGFTQAIVDQMNNQSQIPDTFYGTYYWGNIAEKIVGIMNR